jgi:fumarylacetoacetate (FAA) hydrolase family protein
LTGFFLSAAAAAAASASSMSASAELASTAAFGAGGAGGLAGFKTALGACCWVKAATLGNDVNLRDVEGRSALLLGKAKDNNAAAAIGPFLRVFDDSFGIHDVRQMELTLTVTGTDGFTLTGRSSMAEISRDPLDLVAQTIGKHHPYPDGMMLYCGTMFAPVQDRDGPGQGFTHHIGDLVTIAAPALGALTNVVRLSTQAPPWTFGTAALMRNLAGRGLL